MYAVIETGGKQYLVKEGQVLKVEKLDGDVGSKLTFDKVLLEAKDDGADVKIGMPYLDGAKVIATIQDQGREKKIRVTKYKRKVRYKRIIGHRQAKTQIKIAAIA